MLDRTRYPIIELVVSGTSFSERYNERSVIHTLVLYLSIWQTLTLQDLDTRRFSFFNVCLFSTYLQVYEPLLLKSQYACLCMLHVQ